VAALRHAQALFTASIGALKDASPAWHEAEPKAIKLRYALRGVPNARRAFKAIREGAGNPDMLKNLSALCALGRRHQNELNAINYDLALLAAAETKTAELNRLYTDAFVEEKTADSRTIRIRANSTRLSVGYECIPDGIHVRSNNAENGLMKSRNIIVTFFQLLWRRNRVIAFADPLL
jgi:hypothetical protein